MKFVWTPACQLAFTELHTQAMNASILQYTDINADACIFILVTDSSETGIGKMLPQMDTEIQEHIIAKSGGCLSKSERNSAQSERKGLS